MISAPAHRMNLSHRISRAGLIYACLVCLLPLTGARAAELPPPTQPASIGAMAQPAGDDATATADLCFESLLGGTGDAPSSAYCDLLINRLNGNLNRSAGDNRLLAAAYNNRAVDFSRQRELEQADADIEQALNLQPELAELYLTRGNLRLLQQRFADARADFDTALALSDGQLQNAWSNRALANRGLGLLAEAHDDLLRAAGASIEPTVTPGDPSDDNGGSLAVERP